MMDSVVFLMILVSVSLKTQPFLQSVTIQPLLSLVTQKKTSLSYKLIALTYLDIQ